MEFNRCPGLQSEAGPIREGDVRKHPPSQRVRWKGRHQTAAVLLLAGLLVALTGCGKTEEDRIAFEVTGVRQEREEDLSLPYRSRDNTIRRGFAGELDCAGEITMIRFRDINRLRSGGGWLTLTLRRLEQGADGETRRQELEKLEEKLKTAVDISESGRGELLCLRDGETLVIFADRIAYAPEDSSYLFSGFDRLRTIEFNGLLCTEGVTDMTGMFADCSALEQVDLEDFDTASVREMEGMFRNCGALRRLDLSSFTLDAAEHMGDMFAGHHPDLVVTINGSFDRSRAEQAS